MRIIGDTKRPIKIWATDLEPEAETQVRNIGNLPFIYKHVAVMPDAHAGKGSTIGTVIASKGAIIPSAIGVDIGCGMSAVKLRFDISAFGHSVSELRSSIERSIPVGFNCRREITPRINDALMALPEHTLSLNKAAYQLGTLGGGNHFIEICQDTQNGAWVVLHSGSRNLGKVLAEKHIENAKGLMKKYFVDLPDPDLAFLAQNTSEFDAYIVDLKFAQAYAKANRKEMMLRVLKDISYTLFKEDRGIEAMTSLWIDCHHNYTTMENHYGENVWITRKGAVSAKAGEFGIIPGSMGTKSYIVEGLGNPESFFSCAHGAGRRMSRTKARQQFTQADLEAQTQGVECRKDEGVLDEIPAAYKNIDVVMENQKDLVKVLYELKQILCIKG